MLPRYLPLMLLCMVSLLGAEPKRDGYGDPLPEGAIARLGSLVLRNEELILTAAFTPDGKTLAAAGSDSISFWDPVTGKLVRRVQLKNGEVKNAALRVQLAHISADSKTLIQTLPNYRGILYVLDARSGTPQGTLSRPKGGHIPALDLSRDGKVLAAVYWDSIVLFDVPRAKLLHEFKGPPAGALSPLGVIALTPDSKQLVLPHADGSLHLVDVASGKELRAFEMPPLRPGVPPSPRIQRLAVSPDGRYLAFDGPATPLTVCELATGKRLHELGPVPGYHLAFTPNGQVLAVDVSRGIRLFDVASGKEIRTLPLPAGGFHRLLFSPDGRTLAAVNGYIIRFWDMTAQRWLHPPTGHEGVIHSLAFFPDGKRLVSTDYSNEIRVWDIASAEVVAKRRNLSAASLAVDRDGKRVRFADYEISAHHWDFRTGSDEVQRRVVVVPGLFPNALALSPDGRSLAVQAAEAGGAGQKRRTYSLRLYDVKTNQSTALPGLPPQSRVSHVLFTPDSRRLAARCPDGTVCLWDRDTGKLVRELKSEKPSAPPMHLPLAFAADGRTLLTWINNLLRIRECTSGATRLQIPVAPKSLSAVAYAPDARFLACGQLDGRILVYSAVSGKELAQWQGKQGPVRSLAFSRDGRFLASGGANGTILIWKVPQDDSVRAIRNAGEAVSLWQALGATDAAAANRALAGLAAAPAQALPLFKERFRSTKTPLSPERLARLIADLDADAFKVRERATRELALAGNDAADALRQALDNNPSAESKRRIEDLLARLKPGGYSQRLRLLRAIEVLERIGTPPAKELLRDLAGQPSSDELKEEVQASLRRLGAKP